MLRTIAELAVRLVRMSRSPDPGPVMAVVMELMLALVLAPSVLSKAYMMVVPGLFPVLCGYCSDCQRTMLIVQSSIHAASRTYHSPYAQIDVMCRAALRVSRGRGSRKRCASRSGWYEPTLENPPCNLVTLSVSSV